MKTEKLMKLSSSNILLSYITLTSYAGIANFSHFGGFIFTHMYMSACIPIFMGDNSIATLVETFMTATFVFYGTDCIKRRKVEERFPTCVSVTKFKGSNVAPWLKRLATPVSGWSISSPFDVLVGGTIYHKQQTSLSLFSPGILRKSLDCCSKKDRRILDHTVKRVRGPLLLVIKTYFVTIKRCSTLTVTVILKIGLHNELLEDQTTNK